MSTIDTNKKLLNARRQAIIDAIEQENDPAKKQVLNQIAKHVDKNGFYSYGNVFEGQEALYKDTEFIKTCIKLLPTLYTYITPELQDNQEVLLALARSPIFYNDPTLGDYGSYAICPLWYILDAHFTRQIIKSNPNPLIKTKKTTQGIEHRIDDANIILTAIQAELDSFEYCTLMESLAKPIIPYEGLATLQALQDGKDISFGECTNLRALSYATDEISTSPDFQQKVEELLTNWKNNTKNSSSLQELNNILTTEQKIGQHLDKQIALIPLEQSRGDS